MAERTFRAAGVARRKAGYGVGWAGGCPLLQALGLLAAALLVVEQRAPASVVETPEPWAGR